MSLRPGLGRSKLISMDLALQESWRYDYDYDEARTVRNQWIWPYESRKGAIKTIARQEQDNTDVFSLPIVVWVW